MSMRRFCILMQWTGRDNDNSGLLIEQLRYAGLVKVIKEDATEHGPVFMLELNAPKGYDSEGGRVWAKQNADRMRSFGINAVDTFAS